MFLRITQDILHMFCVSYIQLWLDGNSVFGMLHRVDVRNVRHTYTLKMDAAYSSQTSAESPTTTRHNNSRTELTSIINHRESLKSVINLKKVKLSLCLLH
jgi:hypothetical protein